MTTSRVSVATRIGSSLVAALIFLGGSAHAQERPATSGEIAYEETKEERSGYSDQQDAAIELLKALGASLAAGGTWQIAAPSDAAVNYLSGAYLFCSVNTGACPFLVQAVFEIDVLNAKASGQPLCPVMTGFWKHWVRNGFEERHKYLVKTPFMQETNDFKQNERPKYLKCKETIAGLLEGKAIDSKRYAEGSEVRKSVERATRYLELLKATVPNVFVAMGAQRNVQEEPPSKAGPRGGTGQRPPTAAGRGTRR